MIKNFYKSYLKKILLLLLFLLVAYSSYSFGTVNERRSLAPKLNAAIEEKSVVGDKLKNLTSEFDRCVEDRAELVATSKDVYSFHEFGLYSPLFIGRDFSAKTFDYKKTKTLHKNISLDDGVSISLWEPQNGEFSFAESPIDFPIFEGGEWEYSTVLISTKKTYWNEKNKYAASGGMTFYLREHDSFDLRSKAFQGVSLETINTLSPSRKPAFIQIYVPMDESLEVVERNDPAYLQAVKTAKEIADTLSFRVVDQGGIEE